MATTEKTFDLGSQRGGNAGATVVGTPTPEDTYYTFDGATDGLDYGAEVNGEDDLAIYARFRWAGSASHRSHTIYKSGNTIAAGLGIDDGRLVWRSNYSGTLRSLAIPYYLMPAMNSWIKCWANRQYLIMEIEATGERYRFDYGSTCFFYFQTGTESIGYAKNNGVLRTESGDCQFFNGDIDRVVRYPLSSIVLPTEGLVTLPSTYRHWIYGTNNGGTNANTYIGGTVLADALDFNGTSTYCSHNSSIDDTTVEVYVKFSCDNVTKNAAQTIWKVGDHTNGFAVGFDASNQFGLFSRNAGVLSQDVDTTGALSNGVVYEVYAKKTRCTVLNAATGAIVLDLTTGVPVNTDSNRTADIGAAYKYPVISGNAASSAGDFFDGQIYAQIYGAASSLIWPNNPVDTVALEDVALAIQLHGTAMEDLATRLSLSKEGLDDLRTLFALTAPAIEDLATLLSIGNYGLDDIRALLTLTDGTVLEDLAAALYLTDGTVLEDVLLHCTLLRPMAENRAVIAQRLRSVKHA